LTHTSGDKRRILVLFRASSGLRILLGKDADNAGSYLMVDDSLVILTHNIDAEFLGQCETEES
jgi:hypothetical protein